MNDIKIPKYLYHLTDSTNVENILKIGLEPCIGIHSQFVEEPESQVYLSDYSSLPYWRILFVNTITIQKAKWK